MNPSAASKGNSFAGAIGYITHDVGKASAERVTFTEVLNMRTSDPEKAASLAANLMPTKNAIENTANFANGWKRKNPARAQ